MSFNFAELTLLSREIGKEKTNENDSFVERSLNTWILKFSIGIITYFQVVETIGNGKNA